MLSWLRVLILSAACVLILAEDKSLDALIDDVFKPEGGSEGKQEGDVGPKVPNLEPNQGGEDSLPGVSSDCTCVPFYLCNNGSINTNGEGIIDIRISDSPCGTYIKVCCDKDKIEEKPITTTPSTINPPPTGCGYRHPDGVGFRITGDKDHESQFGEFPWMVAILREERVEGNPQALNVYQCGGSLIHPQAVITGAHCVSGKGKSYKIRAGEWDTQHTEELLPHQDMEVDKVIIHQQYYAGALYNDIALLILKHPITIAENVNVVCLPKQNHIVESSRCFATGWGKDVFGKQGKYQVILKKIDLPIVPNPKCESQLRTTRLGSMFKLHRSFICAGGEAGKDTCKGDGGSPLVCPIPGTSNQFFQTGIVAWGIGCGEQIPGVYVNVALFRDWIDEHMKFNGLDVNTYQN